MTNDTTSGDKSKSRPRRRGPVRMVWLAIAAASFVALLASGTATVLRGQEADAAQTNYLAWICGNYDCWYNYDYDSDLLDVNDWTELSMNVDWPMRWVFRDNAEIDKVKHALDGVGSDPAMSPSLGANGGQKYAHFWTKKSPSHSRIYWWDEDGGIKNEPNCAWGYHMRLYATDPQDTGTDQNYNLDYGYYIFASHHNDYENTDVNPFNNCTERFRSLESNESGFWLNRISAINSYLTTTDWQIYYGIANWLNPENELPCQSSDYHCVNSDGWATYIKVNSLAPSW